jgi:hypothetical protein
MSNTAAPGISALAPKAESLPAQILRPVGDIRRNRLASCALGDTERGEQTAPRTGQCSGGTKYRAGASIASCIELLRGRRSLVRVGSGWERRRELE